MQVGVRCAGKTNTKFVNKIRVASYIYTARRYSYAGGKFAVIPILNYCVTRKM